MKISVIACNGKMGKALLELIYLDEESNISGGLVRKESFLLNKDLGEFIGYKTIKVKATDNIEQLCANSDIIIDFSSPDYSLEIINIAKNYNLFYICGTTGFDQLQLKILHQNAKKIPIIHSSNMSIGVNILAKLTEELSSVLDEEFDIEIIESHHRFKVDSPSGTALMLGNAAAKGRNIDLQSNSVKSRDGIIGKRKKGDIGFATIRGGDIIGDHTVLFAGSGERIELTHKASNRSLFAKGALKAAKYAFNNKIKPGKLYDMKDVLFSK